MLTSADGLKLHTQNWYIDNPKAAVVVVHGMGEHIGRYHHVAVALNQAGYAAVGLDHRGHGNSDGEPRTFIKNIDIYVDDLKLLWDRVAADFPGKPIFMLGHSMGGLIATRFTLRYQDQVRGLVVTGVGLMASASIPSFVITLGKGLAKVAPQLKLTALDTKQLSRDPAVVKTYETDPLVYHDKLRAGMVATYLIAGGDVIDKASALKLPLLILHGEKDQIVSARASQALYDHASSSDKTLKIYPELFHEIMNEPEQNMVLGEIVRWLDSH